MARTHASVCSFMRLSTTAISTLSLHDALPIYSGSPKFFDGNTSLIVATVTTGDAVCRATSKDYRLDTSTARALLGQLDRKSTRLNSSHSSISYAVFCLKKKRGLGRVGMVKV